MGMTTHIIGFVEPDEKYRNMLSIYKQCTELSISCPDEVHAFFRESWKPDEKGFEIDLVKERKSIVTTWSSVYGNEKGFELNVLEIPGKITTIRFYNSW